MRRRCLDWHHPATELQRTVVRYCDLKAGTWQPRTVLQRRYRLLRLVEFLEGRHPGLRTWADLKRHPHLEDWLQSLQQYLPASKMDYLQTVAQFFRELQEWQWPDPPADDLFRSTDRPRLPKRLPKPLDPESDRRLRAVLDADPCVRNLALCLLRETGLRAGELLSLPSDAVRQDRAGQWEMKVPLGKTLTERIFPLMPAALAYVRAILDRRGRHVPDKPLPDRLIIDEDGLYVPRWTLLRHMKRMAWKAGLPHWPRVHLHQFRHTFASELARAQIPLPSLMRLLGHRRPTMTMLYVALSNTDVRQAYEEAIHRLPTLNALRPIPQRVLPTDDASVADQLLEALTTLDRQRRDTTPGSPQARQLQHAVRLLQATLRSLKKHP